MINIFSTKEVEYSQHQIYYHYLREISKRWFICALKFKLAPFQMEITRRVQRTKRLHLLLAIYLSTTLYLYTTTASRNYFNQFFIISFTGSLLCHLFNTLSGLCSSVVCKMSDGLFLFLRKSLGATLEINLGSTAWLIAVVSPTRWSSCGKSVGYWADEENDDIERLLWIGLWN